jgi:hypothetical protein
MAPRRINAMVAGDLHRELRVVNKSIERMTREISGADSEPVKKAASLLLRNWRRLLNVQGGGKAAAPGQPPRRQSGVLWKSMKQAVVDGVRRVGSGNFRSWMTEFGVGDKPPRPHARPALEMSERGMADGIVVDSQRAVAKAPI